MGYELLKKYFGSPTYYPSGLFKTPIMNLQKPKQFVYISSFIIMFVWKVMNRFKENLYNIVTFKGVRETQYSYFKIRSD